MAARSKVKRTRKRRTGRMEVAPELFILANRHRDYYWGPFKSADVAAKFATRNLLLSGWHILPLGNPD